MAFCHIAHCMHVLPAGGLSPGSVKVGLPAPSAPTVASRISSYLFGGGKAVSAASAPAPSVILVSGVAAAAPVGGVSAQGVTLLAAVAPLSGPGKAAALMGGAPKVAPRAAPAKLLSGPPSLAPGVAPGKQAARAPAAAAAGMPVGSPASALGRRAAVVLQARAPSYGSLAPGYPAAQGPSANAAGLKPAARGPTAA